MSRRSLSPEALFRRDALGTGLLFAGILALVVALAWWAVVFLNVAANTSLTIPAAVPCLVNTSDLCSLAMSLCGAGHWLGIPRYWEGLFWAGAVLTLAAGAFQLAFTTASAVETGSRRGGEN
ncbi:MULTISPECIES: hypothetical protein [Kaistia]|uniref:Uncharacterized protein n=1 Tax=Kaistia nematophila TaxID=2994654 RepID=A0A9X3E401_9HYPH|nr:hypothetical protein [Kaistia nematophila]MBN9058966.1 hypothetical protein [Hyphomicrobiales bacterium]MCX5570352.1 hypothetical protein [Kaistia nematophila]